MRIRRLLFIIIIVGVAVFAAYQFGLFNRKTETFIDKAVQKTKNTAETVTNKIKETIELK